MTEKMMALFRQHLKVKHNRTLYEYQERIAYAIFDSLIQNLRITAGATEEQIKKLKPLDIPFEISRQAGKTTVIVHAIEFVMIFFTEAFGRSLQIGIFAPQIEQAKTDFDRLKLALRQSNDDLLAYTSDEQSRIAKEESNARTLVLPNGTSCFIFPVTPTSKPESKTLDLIIFEESQDLPAIS